MFLSVIIPVYNAEKYLAACFDSILKQTFTDYEVIAIDDGSKDGSGKICDEYALKDERIKVFHNENSGPSAARNFGFKKAVGEYIYCVDNDDEIKSEDYFEKIHSSLIENPVEILLTGATYYNEENDCVKKTLSFDGVSEEELSSPKRCLSFLVSNKKYETSCWTKVIKRDFLIENQLFFDEKLTVEDLDWNMRFWQYVKTFGLFNDCSYVHFYRKGSISTSFGERGYSNCLDQITTIERWREVYENAEDEELKKPLLSYLNFQFFITLGKCQHLEKKKRKDIEKRLKKIEGITKYSVEKRQKLFSRIYRFFGLKLSAIFLGWYYKHR